MCLTVPPSQPHHITYAHTHPFRYRGHINGKQEIMIGYSDSSKDAGRLAALWAQYEAQVRCLRASV
jgi:phosphoenolpyruvate carboxylase